MEQIKTYGDPLDNAVEQAQKSCVDDNVVRLMADHHLGYGVPVGGVVASVNKISLHGVGYDIGCGNNALKLNVKIDDFGKDELTNIAKTISSFISFGVGRKNDDKEALNTEFASFLDNPEIWNDPLFAEYEKLAKEQFGTVGSGNHYVDVLFSQKDGFVYLANHFGSRGFGHKLATKFYTLYGSKDSIDADPVYADLSTDLGQDYLRAMTLAGQYALNARRWALDKINSELFNAEVIETIENHHNFSWKENHNGQDYWVTRKGATPLYVDKLSFVGGTMTTNSYIVKGKESEQYNNTLRSTVHGAGRLISRKKASGSRWKKGEQKFKGLFSDINMRQFAKDNNILLVGGGADELPMCYKNIDDVINYHSESLEIVDVLTPIVVLMAGSDEFDPYKD